MKYIVIFFLLISTLYAGIGEVTAAKGSVSLTRKGFSRSVKVGLEMLRKDLITTKKRSKAQVILNDDTVITVGPESSYRFLEYAQGKNPEVLMQLDRGFFKAVTGKIGKIAPHRFKIKTRAATIGVRGTQFMAHVAVDSEQIGCVQGTIMVTTVDKIFVVPSGKMLVYQNGEWYMKNMDFHLFSPVTLTEENDPSALPLESYLLVVNADDITGEQELKQRAAPGQSPEDPDKPDIPDIPSETFDISLDADNAPSTEPYTLDNAISVPVIITPNSYEISSDKDDATPPPPFHPMDDISVPALIPLPDTYEINSAYDNTTPPPPFNP